MLSREVVVTLFGTPAGKGSMKCVGRGGRHQLIANNAKPQKLWHDAIVDAVLSYSDGVTADTYQPVGVEVMFSLDRPASHFGSGRNADKIARSAPEHPTTRGTNDVDKLARLVLDALQDARIIVDDAQVVEIVARKSYSLLEPDQMGFAENPPAWIASQRNHADSLPYVGARIRVYPIETW